MGDFELGVGTQIAQDCSATHKMTAEIRIDLIDIPFFNTYDVVCRQERLQSVIVRYIDG
jgi:hypothetical protein